MVGEPGRPPDSSGVTDLVARGVGDRVTMLQALATFQLQAERDPLTGLLNRRSLESAIEPILGAARRYAVAYADLDHFKKLNDLHGHEAGDRALRAFARTLRDSLRPQDLVCRWGGEEFVIVLPDCDADYAIDAMDRVRTNLALGSMGGQTAAVTASFGVAHSSDADSFDEVVERADSALHQAKDRGRNRVARYESGGVSASPGVGDVISNDDETVIAVPAVVPTAAV
jgi:diguanylate cyclase (GGDEF)-like protein